MPNYAEEVVAIVLRDVAASSPLKLIAEPVPFEAGHHSDGVLLSFAGQGELGVIVGPSEPFEGRLLRAADVVQDWILDSLPGQGHPAVWPQCPDHPGTHPLQPTEHPDGAVWTCPKSHRAIAPIGSLPGSG